MYLFIIKHSILKAYISYTSVYEIIDPTPPQPSTAKVPNISLLKTLNGLCVHHTLKHTYIALAIFFLCKEAFVGLYTVLSALPFCFISEQGLKLNFAFNLLHIVVLLQQLYYKLSFYFLHCTIQHTFSFDLFWKLNYYFLMYFFKSLNFVFYFKFIVIYFLNNFKLHFFFSTSHNYTRH